MGILLVKLKLSKKIFRFKKKEAIFLRKYCSFALLWGVCGHTCAFVCMGNCICIVSTLIFL